MSALVSIIEESRRIYTFFRTTVVELPGTICENIPEYRKKLHIVQDYVVNIPYVFRKTPEEWVDQALQKAKEENRTYYVPSPRNRWLQQMKIEIPAVEDG